MKDGMKIKKSKGKKLKIVLAFVLAFIVIIAAVIYYVFGVKTIEFAGSRHYTDEQLEDKIFDGHKPNAVLYLLFGNKDKKIPFIQKYDVEVEWPDKMYVTVYEKAITGYIKYMGCNMYFDKDGIVVESSTESYENVPEITGLTFSSIVLGSKLDVGDDNVFNQILDLTQSFDKYYLDVDRVFFDSSHNIILYMGDVKINLGGDADYTDKLYELKQMASKFKGLKGTLHMENYNGNDTSIIFKKEEN